jgi:hypothetical protein
MWLDVTDVARICNFSDSIVNISFLGQEHGNSSVHFRHDQLMKVC